MARQLERAYATYNRKYFKGSLPIIRVLWSKIVPEDCFGWYTPEGGECGTILLSEEMKKTRNLWQMTLLHEMCHVKLRDQPEEIQSKTERHSKSWKKEMRRLAAAGAFDKLW